MSAPLLAVEGLVKKFSSAGGDIAAVDGVSLTIERGETFGLVGESGSGKSTLARCILRLEDVDSGSIVFDGKDLIRITGREMRDLRARIQVVFQDPHASLNRRMSVSDIIAVPLVAHRTMSKGRRAARVRELLNLVQLSASTSVRRPGELSGGQAQRVAIARALALSPDFVVLDEAVSGLDVSVRAQVLNLLKSLQRDLHLTYLFISHDLSVVRYVAGQIGVMYRGRIVETGGRSDLFARPQHPYTCLLLDAVPVADPVRQRGKMRAEVDREDDADAIPRVGCRFRPRCGRCAGRARCADVDPVLHIADTGQTSVACHYPRGNDD